jgi:exonuclease III
MKVIDNEKPDIICINETKLQRDLYLDNYWSYQTMFQRKGGCWTATRNRQNVRHQLVKALGSYLCWTRLTTGNI